MNRYNPKSKKYAAICQAEYKNGQWSGSIGLRAKTFTFSGGASKKFAEDKARAKLVKLHIHVEAL